MPDLSHKALSELNLELMDEAQSLQFAQCFAEQRPHHPALVIFLKGDLGTGKTTFSRGFIQASGYSGKVKSPTYTLIEPYVLSNLTITHMDLYRLSDPEELHYLDVDDLIQNSDVCLIEWPERGADLLPVPTVTLSLKHYANGRQLHAESHCEIGRGWLETVRSHFTC